MDDCVFCRIVKREEPAEIIWEDAQHVAFLDIFPNTEGFTVVATKKHWPSYAFENSDQVLNNLIIATKKVAGLLDKSFEDVGRCGMIFEGYGVDHLHSKLSPMHGTANMSKWTPVESPRKTFYKKYPGYLSSHRAGRASEKKLKRIAEKIRELSD